MSRGCCTDYNGTVLSKDMQAELQGCLLLQLLSNLKCAASRHANPQAKRALAKRLHMLLRSTFLWGLDLYTVHPPC